MEASKSWIRLPMSILSDLSDTAAIVYAVMLDQCPRGTYKAYIKQSRIAAITNRSDRTIRRAIKELKDKSYILTIENNGRGCKYIMKPIIQPKKRDIFSEQDEIESEIRMIIGRS